MLFYDFKNYEEFKELFGFIEHGNGVKSRKNKILLALYKDKQVFKDHITVKVYNDAYMTYLKLDDRCERILRENPTSPKLDKVSELRNHYNFIRKETSKTRDLMVTDISMLKRQLYNYLSSSSLFNSEKPCYRLNLMDRTFYSDSYETDDMNGLCEDGTINAIRYRNIEKDKVFKMKAGKMFNNIMSCNTIMERMPEQIKRWLSEEFVADWILYAKENIGDTEYTLHVDDNFKDIYERDCCKGYDRDSDCFGSCMMDDDQWTFYRDAVDAEAAYLTDSDGMIVARCIVFTDVKDEEGNKWRLAERQYAYNCDDALKRMLVSALIREGHIDGYKRVGSSCHDARAFVTNDGESLADKQFHIRCNLEYGDTLSYQDSFKWYDYDNDIADNYGDGNAELDVTDSTFGGGDDEDSHDNDYWSDYHQEWIPEDEAYFVDSRNDSFYYHEVSEARVRQNNGTYRVETCFNDDCIEINGEMYYAGEDASYPEDFGIYECPYCGNWFVPGEEDSCYSDLTEEDYCCGECAEEAEKQWHEDNGHVYAEYDEKWFEDAEDVITAKHFRYNHFHEETISVEEFNYFVEVGLATEYEGAYYIDKVLMDGSPAHLLTLQKCVA